MVRVRARVRRPDPRRRGIPLEGGPLRALKVTLVALFLAYLLGGFAAWRFQEALLFPAPSVPMERLEAGALSAGARSVHITTEDGVRLYGWHHVAEGERIVIYFHGNGESVLATPDLGERFDAIGWDVLKVALRGYPGSEGEPSAEGMAEDARATWRFVVDKLGYPPDHVVLYGRSMGGGVVGSLMTEVEPGGIVLESTYTSLLDMARLRYPMYPVGLLLRHRFDTAANAPKVDVPVLVLHGDQDGVIPVEQGRTLGRLFPNVTYVEQRGFGHNDDLAFRGRDAWLALEAFLEPIGR